MCQFEAIGALGEAARATPADDPHLASRLVSLGDAFAARLRHTGATRDRNAAIAAYAKAARQELAQPRDRIRAARAAADLVPDAAPGRAADFLETAVRLLGDLAPRALPRGDQQHQIREFASLASDAAAFALADERGTASRARRSRAQPARSWPRRAADAVAWHPRRPDGPTPTAPRHGQAVRGTAGTARRTGLHGRRRG